MTVLGPGLVYRGVEEFHNEGMRKWILGVGLCGLWGLSGPAEARVFKMGEEHFATYLRGQYQVAGQKDEAFAASGGSGAVYDSSYTSNMAYEFGLVYASTRLNWRFGFEVLKPADLKDIKGKSSGGTTWYTLGNTISGYAPKIGLELSVKNWSASRFFLNADYGYATVNVQNSYTFTSAGTTQFTGMADFREEMEGTGSLVETSMGFETILSDTTTIILDAGYRVLQINELKHKQAVKTFQGTVAKGDAAKNTDGSPRTLNLSGAFASVWLRFWIQ